MNSKDNLEPRSLPIKDTDHGWHTPSCSSTERENDSLRKLMAFPSVSSTALHNLHPSSHLFHSWKSSDPSPPDWKALFRWKHPSCIHCFGAHHHLHPNSYFEIGAYGRTISLERFEICVEGDPMMDSCKEMWKHLWCKKYNPYTKVVVFIFGNVGNLEGVEAAELGKEFSICGLHMIGEEVDWVGVSSNVFKEGRYMDREGVWAILLNIICYLQQIRFTSSLLSSLELSSPIE